MFGVTVIVCCHNSASRVLPTLECLWNQDIENVPFEVILIDNNCTDDTVQLALKSWKSSKEKVPFRVVKEIVPGLSAARHKGIQESKYDYIIFCDDDNHLSKHYASRIVNILQSDPLIGVVGGNGIFRTNISVPVWLESLKGCFATGPQSTKNGDITNTKGYVYGAGIGLRKKLLLQIESLGLSSILTDRKGKELSSGGDTELCYLIRKLGYSLWYQDDLTFVHEIEAKRISKEYMIKLFKGFGKSNVYLHLYEYHFFDNFGLVAGGMFKIKRANSYSRFGHMYLWFVYLSILFQLLRHSKWGKKNQFLEKNDTSWLMIEYFQAQFEELISSPLKFYRANKKIIVYSRLLENRGA